MIRPLPAQLGRHGHVNHRPDGMLNRCGGPALCGACAVERCDRCGLAGSAAMAHHEEAPDD